ncbi:type IV pilus secretin PilQ [Thermovibrio sp.]
MRKLLLSGLLLFPVASYGGTIEDANFIYIKGSSPLNTYLEADIKKEGKCSVKVQKETEKELEILLNNCKLTKEYTAGARGDFVKSISLKPAGEGALLKIELKKAGTLKIEKDKSLLKFLVYEGKRYEPKINIVKTISGEEIVIELPIRSLPEYEKREDKLIIKVPNTYFKEEVKRPNSSLLKKIETENKEGAGVIKLYLSDRVGATELERKGETILITLYKKREIYRKEVASQERKGQKLALHFTNADVRSVVKAIANVAGINVVFDPEVKGKVNVDFKEPVYWEDALKAVLEPLNLTYIKTPYYYRILPKKKLLSERQLEPVNTYIVPLNYAKAEDVVKDIKKFVGKDSREVITYNTDTNSLILKLTPSDYDQIIKLVKKLDIPLKQVLVKAKIVQISSKAEKDLGFTWFISLANHMGTPPSSYIASTYGFNTAGYSPLINPDSIGKVLNLPVMDSTLAVGILNKSQTFRVELALKALELNGDAQTISSPKVLTLDNQEATIEQGIEIPYRESTVAAGGATSYQIAFKKASLILKVKPHVTRNNKIILDLEVRKDSPNYDYVAITGNNEPAINTRNVKSRVIVDNGNTVVIGGIYEKEKTVSKAGVPILSRIPLLGWLFKSKKTTVNKSELLIFITPTLINTKGESYGISK